MKTKIITISVFIVFAMTFFLVWHYQLKKDSKPEIFTQNNAAIDGYDVVAFFDESKPVKGKAEFSMRYKEVDWYFSTEKKRLKFKTNPESYLPQYGGYCAYGMSKGYKAQTEIDTWTIVNGKLYFNYNQEVKEIWNKDPMEYIEKANENWKNIKH